MEMNLQLLKDATQLSIFLVNTLVTESKFVVEICWDNLLLYRSDPQKIFLVIISD